MSESIGVANSLGVTVTKGIGIWDYALFFGIIAAVVLSISLIGYFAYKKHWFQFNAEPIIKEKEEKNENEQEIN